MELPQPRTRRLASAARAMALVAAVMATANALALLMVGPPGSDWGPGGAYVGPAIPRAASPSGPRRAEAAERLRRMFVFMTFNTIAVSGLAFAALARRMESWRRGRMGIPEGLDEEGINPHVLGREARPRAASEYRPSLN